MPSIGLSEILVISVIALFIIKPRDIPAMARKAGRILRMFREYRDTLMREVDSVVNLDNPGEEKKTRKRKDRRVLKIEKVTGGFNYDWNYGNYSNSRNRHGSVRCFGSAEIRPFHRAGEKGTGEWHERGL